MTKRKFNRFVDVLTVLAVIFPLLLALATSFSWGTYDSVEIADFVQNFAISTALADKIGESIQTFGIAFDGAFFAPSCVLLANALIIYLFRLFAEILVFVPKMALKLINIKIGEND